MEPAYRAYILDEEDHILKAVIIEADSDVDATSRAASLLDGHDIEIWDGSRLVARLPRSV